MPNLCFKTKPNARTVQLIRYRYCNTRKRSIMITLGSLDLAADPEHFKHNLHLRPDAILDAHEEHAVAQWLRQHGDPKAAQRRIADEQRIRACIQEEIAAAQSVSGNPLQRATESLQAAVDALPGMADVIRARGGDPWSELRPQYLAVYQGWKALESAAQSAGVAKCKSRTQTAAAEASDLLVALDEDCVL